MYNINMKVNRFNNFFTVIMPLYGKEKEIITPIIKNTASILNKFAVKLIILYKNSEDDPSFNYDYLVNLLSEYDNVTIEQVPVTFKRTYKTIQGLEKVSSRYFQIMDAHHQISEENFKLFIEFLQSAEISPYFLNSYIKRDFDDDWVKTYNWNSEDYSIGAGASIFNTNFFRPLAKNINVDIIYSDDWTFPNLTINNLIDSNGNFVSNIIDIPWYIRNQAKGMSTTSKDSPFNISDDLIVSISNAYAWLEKIDVNSSHGLRMWKIVLKLIENFFISRNGDIDKLESLEIKKRVDSRYKQYLKEQ